MFLTAFTLYTVIAILIADAIASEVATHIVPQLRAWNGMADKMGPYSVVLFASYGLFSWFSMSDTPLIVIFMWAMVNSAIAGALDILFNQFQFYPEYETSIRVTARIRMLLGYASLFSSYALLFPYQLMH